MAKILKVLTPAGAKKHQFDLSQMQDVTAKMIADFRLKDSESKSLTSGGFYTQNQIIEFTNDPQLFKPTKEPSTDHPNAKNFQFAPPPFNTAGYFKAIQTIKKTGPDININNALKANASAAATRWLTIPLSAANYFAKESAETYPTLQVQITTTSGSKNIIVKGVRELNPASNGGSFSILKGISEVGIKGILTTGIEVVVDTKIPVSATYAYRFRKVNIVKAGQGFADANGARFKFPAGLLSSQLDASFDTETFQRNNAVDVTLAGLDIAKTINVSEEKFNEELIRFLNFLPGNFNYIEYPPGFYEITEDE